MTQPATTPRSNLLRDLPPYIYGTTRLGDGNIAFEDRVQLARTAMNSWESELPSGMWFHTSHTYGNALEVLHAAFAQEPHRIPKLIVKLGWSTMPEFKDVLRQNLEGLGIASLELGQLCLGGELGQQFAEGGAAYEDFARMKADGLVRRFVVEVFPWSSAQSLSALRGGYMDGVVDGFIFYLNPLQRFASNELWDEIVARNEPVIAMRTVAGGPVHKLRDEPGFAWRPYLQERATQVAPIFERSGVPTWTEFCVRYAHSIPVVRATVGSTGRPQNLQEYFDAAGRVAGNPIQPLPQDIIDEIAQLQRRWSDDVDMKSEIWSM